PGEPGRSGKRPADGPRPTVPDRSGQPDPGLRLWPDRRSEGTRRRAGRPSRHRRPRPLSRAGDRPARGERARCRANHAPSPRAIAGRQGSGGPEKAQALTRVLILGAGFAGLAAARAFERHLPSDRRITVTLVCRNNYQLFTPMLAEVVAGEIDAAHIATPTRAFLRRVHVQQGDVVAIDLERRRVQVFSPVIQDQTELPYDHLILALGSVASFRHASGAAEHAFPFRHIGH